MRRPSKYFRNRYRGYRRVCADRGRPALSLRAWARRMAPVRDLTGAAARAWLENKGLRSWT